MKSLLVGLLVSAILVAACSDETEGSACPDISGNYSSTSSTLSSTCPPRTDSGSASTVTFAKEADGRWGVIFPGLTNACPGTLTAACRYTASCTVEKDGKPVLTYSLDYTFSVGGFTGSSVVAAGPPVVEKSCTETYREVAKKL